MPPRLSEDFSPAGKFGGEVFGHAGQGSGGWHGTQVERVEKSLTGERGVGEIAGVAKIGFEIIAAPDAGGLEGKGAVPAEDELAGVGFVAEFTTRGLADVVAHEAAESDEVDVAAVGGAEAEIDVFAAVDERGVEAAEFFPECATDDDTGAGHRWNTAVTEGKGREAMGEAEGAGVLGLAFEVDEYAGVIEGAGGGVDLEIADQSGAFAVSAVGGEHGLEPAGREDQVVVEEGEKFAAGDGGAGIVGAGVTEVALVEDDANGGIASERVEPSAGAVGATVVNEDDLVREAGREGGVERGEHRLGEGEAIVEGDDERDRRGLHVMEEG
jgi:hypothetical protein